MIKNKIVEHSVAIVLVGIVFTLIYLVVDRNSAAPLDSQQKVLREYAGLSFMNWNNPAEQAVFKDIYKIFHPEDKTNLDSLIQAIVVSYNSPTSEPDPRRRSFGFRLARLWPMYIKFIFIYLMVLLISSYAARTVAVWRFVRMKQHRSSYLHLFVQHIASKPKLSSAGEYGHFLVHGIRLIGPATAKGILYLVLFSPAYVIAYAFKTRFDTDSVLFMILLGTFSNGLLITYAQKFFTFLINESRKGYLQTAIVKNLLNSYDYRSDDGISIRHILRFKKEFPGHTFDHIYRNARFQYLPAIKEQASFVITGLIIIEMALNIQNHLCYDMLQNILYQDYLSVFLTCFGIFLVVKGTELMADVMHIRETDKYENR